MEAIVKLITAWLRSHWDVTLCRRIALMASSMADEIERDDLQWIMTQEIGIAVCYDELIDMFLHAHASQGKQNALVMRIMKAVCTLESMGMAKLVSGQTIGFDCVRESDFLVFKD